MDNKDLQFTIIFNGRLYWKATLSCEVPNLSNMWMTPSHTNLHAFLFRIFGVESSYYVISLLLKKRM